MTVTGLHYFVALPPTDPTGTRSDELPWIDAGPGVLTGDENVALPPVPAGHFMHHVYIRDEWQTFYVCAKDAKLEWLEKEPVPSTSGARTLFPGEDVDLPS